MSGPFCSASSKRPVLAKEPRACGSHSVPSHCPCVWDLPNRLSFVKVDGEDTPFELTESTFVLEGSSPWQPLPHLPQHLEIPSAEGQASTACVLTCDQGSHSPRDRVLCVGLTAAWRRNTPSFKFALLPEVSAAPGLSMLCNDEPGSCLVMS